MVSPHLRPMLRAPLIGALLLFSVTGGLTAQSVAELASSPPPALRPAPLSEAVAPDRWLGPDKPIHAFAGWWVGAAAYGAAAAADGDPAERRLAATAASLAAGIAKETFDAAVQGEPFSWKDLVADAAGLAALLAFTLAAES